jgi:hypothetical protein
VRRVFRIYWDASAVGGVHDVEFAEQTVPLWRAAVTGRVMSIVSPILEREISFAPEHVRLSLDELRRHGIVLAESEAATLLQVKYMEAAVLGPKWADDALHVAYATLAEADFIVSWNFKHLVNSDRIRNFNRVNRQQGLRDVVILTPGDAVGILDANDTESDED